MQRTMRSDEEKAALIARFEQGGMKAREFCREEGIAYQSFLAWRRRGRGEGRPRVAAPAGFIELALPPAAPEAVAELDLGGGAVVRFFRCGARP
jgi:transposase-like protein